MNLLQRSKTYKTYANAEKALDKVLAPAGLDLSSVRYMISCKPTPEGFRFAPVLVGVDYVQFVHVGITVVG